MTLTELRRLAEAARPVAGMIASKPHAAYLAAISPSMILRLLAVVEAADVMRYVLNGPVGGNDGMTEPPYKCCREYDIARAALEQKP